MVYVCTLSKELQEKAKKELNEDPDRREKDIEHIRQWIKKQPHLNIRTDDFFILRFLRGSKFSLERTKEKIDMHFSLKNMIPEWFRGRDPQDPRLREILKLGSLLPLRETDDEGRTVFLFRQSAYDPKKYGVDELTKAFYLLFDTFYEVDEPHQINGVVMVLDMKGITTDHVLQYPPTVMKKSAVMWQDGYVTRNKCLLYINTSPIFETVFNTFKLFIKDKLRKRIRILSSAHIDQMYEVVPKRILPKEYGGDTHSVQELIDYWMDVIDSKRKWILEDQKNTVDESKRPGKPKKAAEDHFGIDGSFRKLNVD